MAISDLTHDELQATTQACLLEIERRLKPLGKPRLMRKAMRAHGLLTAVEAALHADGHVTARSGGHDKEGSAPTAGG